MAEFLSGDRLSQEVYDIIFEAQKQLLILSPYIKLDDYFKKAVFDKHKSNPELEIIVGFGKNEKNPKKSFSKEDFEYFQEFKNISIVYIPKLHAKFYANESKGIVTSINLYDYSFKNNIEFGVLSERKLFDIGSANIDSVAFQTSLEIIDDNYTVFVKRPVYKKKLLIGKDYMSSEVLLDLTQELLDGKNISKRSLVEFPQESYTHTLSAKERVSREEFENSQLPHSTLSQGKLVSGTVLGKSKGLKYAEVIDVMSRLGLVVDNEISKEGLKLGITYKQNDKGDSWIVYPESLSDLLD